MKFTLIRDTFHPDYTLGALFYDGARYGYTCEDRDRKLEDEPGAKVKGQTAIPRGLYKMLPRYSVRFKKVLPLLIDVPGFEGVRIHGGNTAEDTEGCPLLGEERTENGVRNCASLVSKLTDTLLAAEKAGNDVWIEVK